MHFAQKGLSSNMKEIDNKLTQKFDEYPSFGVLKGVKVFVTNHA